MQWRGVLKRILPFFLTFAAGLFVASFFVAVSAPFSNVSGPFNKYERRGHDRRGCRHESRYLRGENERLRRELMELRSVHVETAPAIPLDPEGYLAPPPPPAPKAPAFSR